MRSQVMSERSIEDRLREEYFDLLPEIRRVAWQLEAEIRYSTLPILHTLNPFEQLVVRSRVKECESAIGSLRRREEGRTFDPDRSSEYSVLKLRDLAGVRVLAFPNRRLIEADQLLRERFPDWTSLPIKDKTGATQAPKYYGVCPDASPRVRGEYQVVPMLLGLFWEVEHSAMYKPTPSLIGISRSREMKDLRDCAEKALLRFETEFERFVRENTETNPS
jgi:hypothetical protein